MRKLKIAVNCCLCSNKAFHEVELPAGWAHRLDGIDDEEDGFCPVHATVADFASSQCRGCVGGWGDCPMWSAFAYSGKRDVTPSDLATIRTGKCPRRVNGTFGINSGRMEEIDLSKQAIAGGVAFAMAIEDYCIMYPAEAKRAWRTPEYLIR